MTLLLFSIFLILMLARVPIAISLSVATGFVLYLTDFNLNMFPQKMFTAMESFPLMAIPGFVLAGIILARGGLTKYLIEALRSWIGHLPGGLAVVSVVACSIFAAISGSSPATAAAVGAIMVPAMVNNGYDKKYAMGIIATAGTLGMLIPPSIVLILYGIIAEISIGKLFMAGVMPGLLLTIILIVYAVYIAKKNNYQSPIKATWKERRTASVKALWGALMPFIILGSIYTGLATPTESAVIAVFYGIIVSAFVYKELRLKDIRPIIVESVNITSMIFLIIGAASVLGLYLANEQIPFKIGQIIEQADLNIWVFYLVTITLLLILGTFLEAVSIILITLPILLPLIMHFGIDPYHFAIVMTISLELGMITPPVGLNLFVISGMTNEKLSDVIKGVFPFIILVLIALVIIVIFPSISTYLPSIMK